MAYRPPDSVSVNRAGPVHVPHVISSDVLAMSPGLPGGPIDILLHADMYRLDHLHEIVDLGLGELVEDGGVALVEWGEAAEPVLGDGALAIRLESSDDDDGHRLITLRTDGERWTGRWEALRSAVARWGVGP